MFRVLCQPDLPPVGASATWVCEQVKKHGLDLQPSSIINLLGKIQDKGWVSKDTLQGRAACFTPAFSLGEALATLLTAFAESYRLTSPDDLDLLLSEAQTAFRRSG